MAGAESSLPSREAFEPEAGKEERSLGYVTMYLPSGKVVGQSVGITVTTDVSRMTLQQLALMAVRHAVNPDPGLRIRQAVGEKLLDMAVLEGKVENIPSTSRKQDLTDIPRFHSVYFRGQALPPYDDNMSLIDLGSELPWKTDCQNIHVICSFSEDKAFEAPSGECALCLEPGAAYWIFKGCGHKCVCKSCMKKVRKDNNEKKGTTKHKPKKKAAPSEAMMTCPLCRVESRPIIPEHYEGKIYEKLTEEEEAAKEFWEKKNATLLGKSA